jgi:hypothetical protein
MKPKKGHLLVVVIRKASSQDSKGFDGKGVLTGLHAVLKKLVAKREGAKD